MCRGIIRVLSFLLPHITLFTCINRDGAICGSKCCEDYMLVGYKCVECPEGKIGTNCEDNCPNNYFGHGCQSQCNCAQTEICSSIYGCVSSPIYGCSRGKRGANCSENCPTNRYGINCTYICHCKHGQYCNPERGCRNVTIPDDLTGVFKLVTGEDEENKTTQQVIDKEESNTPKGSKNEEDLSANVTLISLVYLACVVLICLFEVLLLSRAPRKWH